MDALVLPESVGAESLGVALTPMEGQSPSDALSAIDEWGIDAASLLDVASTNERREKPKVHHETRRKQEVVQLTEELEKRQRGDVIDGLRVECEEIVSRQCQARFSAQTENTKLRKVFKELHRGAVRIERLGRRMLAVQRDMTVARTISFPQYRGPSEDPQLHLLRLDGLSQVASSVFSRGAFASHRSERIKNFRSVVIQDGKPDFDTLEVIFEIARALPFPVDDVANALWIQTTRIMTGNNHVRWMDLFQDSASRVSQFISISVDPADQSVKCSQVAGRREAWERDSVLLVSNVQVQAQDVDRAIGYYNSDVWIRMEPVRCSGSHELSQDSWCRRVRMTPPESMCQSPAQRSRWIQSIVTGTMRKREESILNFNIQAVENMLVDSRKHTAAPILLVH